MTQAQLDNQIANITGEPLTRAHFLGFGLITEQQDDLEPEDVKLVLDCPFCGRPVPYPGRSTDGSEAMAECDRCDVYFGFDPDEIYTVAADEPTGKTAQTASRPSHCHVKARAQSKRRQS
jgi:hypothetical protein